MNNIIVTGGSNLPNGKRVKPSVKELKAMIDTEIDWVVAAKKEFTAYNITLLIRNKYPMLEIVHENVRKYVHNKMDKYHNWSKLAWGYDSKTVDYNGEAAQTYYPLLQTVIGSVSQPTITVTPDVSSSIPATTATTATTTVSSTTVSTPKANKKVSQIVRALPAPNNVVIDWGDD